MTNRPNVETPSRTELLERELKALRTMTARHSPCPYECCRDLRNEIRNVNWLLGENDHGGLHAMSYPHPQDLVNQLQEAIYGFTVASPETPEQVWHMLLNKVAERFCSCPPQTPPDRYDCDVCAATHRRWNDFRKKHKDGSTTEDYAP